MLGPKIIQQGNSLNMDVSTGVTSYQELGIKYGTPLCNFTHSTLFCDNIHKPDTKCRVDNIIYTTLS